jgi:probable rRNA maturation factor
MSEPIIEVLIEDMAWRGLPRVRSLAAKAAAAALTAAMPDRIRASACVALVDNGAIARLNHDFRGERKPTDVLAFPQLPGGTRSIAAWLRKHSGAREPVALGDVVIAFGACKQGARESQVTPVHHLAHLVIHGALHLLGHDHAEPGETARMRALERTALAALGIDDPYAAPTAAATARGKSRR